MGEVLSYSLYSLFIGAPLSLLQGWSRVVYIIYICLWCSWFIFILPHLLIYWVWVIGSIHLSLPYLLLRYSPWVLLRLYLYLIICVLEIIKIYLLFLPPLRYYYGGRHITNINYIKELSSLPPL